MRSETLMPELWNPHAPDNMLVRSGMLAAVRRGELDMTSAQAELRRLVRERKKMQIDGLLQQPTAKERKALADEWSRLYGDAE